MSPVNPAFSLPSFPYPPAPLPGGKGEIFCFLMQGASPLASPGLSRKRHWDRGANHAPGGGGVPSLLPADLAVPEAAGAACLLCRLSTLPLAYLLSPIPPPPFPAGRGRFFVFLCKGLRPLHPRDLNPRGIGSAGVSGACGGARGGWLSAYPAPMSPAGACPVGRLLTLPSRHPAGGLLCLSPVAPANPVPAGGLCPASPVFPAIS